MKKIRRNTRRILTESSDNSDSSIVCDSARTEKVFSQRGPIMHSINLDSITISSIQMNQFN